MGIVRGGQQYTSDSFKADQNVELANLHRSSGAPHALHLPLLGQEVPPDLKQEVGQGCGLGGIKQLCLPSPAACAAGLEVGSADVFTGRRRQCPDWGF